MIDAKMSVISFRGESLSKFGPVGLPLTVNGAVREFEWSVVQIPGLPIHVGEQRPGSVHFAGSAHSVLTLREHPAKVPVVRVHSCCATGDVFHSRKCDCGEQLDYALERIAQHGCGSLVYLSDHEGRGIGLFAKAMAYALQSEGVDTFEANRILGYREDQRDFELAGTMLLSEHGPRPVRVLSNNPEKIRSLERGGLQIAGRDSVDIPPSSHNRRYLESKRLSGHLLRTV
jgi:GTP cyclohydrolase II